MPRWAVTGAAGQLGSDVVELLQGAGEPVSGFDRHALDITDAAAVDQALSAAAPDVVVNCAAYTAVDAAESDEETAYAVNAAAVGHLARWCAGQGARLLHVSTDYVFGGDGVQPYLETDPVAPATAYGRTKLAGEVELAAAGGDGHVVRTAWVYGRVGTNFVSTMRRLSTQRDTVDVVEDQLGCPTWSRDLARGLLGLGVADVAPGVWHCAGGGQASWYDVARQVFQGLGLDPDRVHPTTSAAFPRPAPRPAYSVLSDARWRAAGLPAMPDWRDSLETFLAQPA